jgi:hypothetical protein
MTNLIEQIKERAVLRKDIYHIMKDDIPEISNIIDNRIEVGLIPISKELENPLFVLYGDIWGCSDFIGKENDGLYMTEYLVRMQHPEKFPLFYIYADSENEIEFGEKRVHLLQDNGEKRYKAFHHRNTFDVDSLGNGIYFLYNGRMEFCITNEINYKANLQKNIKASHQNDN